MIIHHLLLQGKASALCSQNLKSDLHLVEDWQPLPALKVAVSTLPDAVGHCIWLIDMLDAGVMQSNSRAAGKQLSKLRYAVRQAGAAHSLCAEADMA